MPCPFCHDLGFKGRFGVYEVFVIDDEVRQIIQSGGNDAALKQVFRKQQERLLQESARKPCKRAKPASKKCCVSFATNPAPVDNRALEPVEPGQAEPGPVEPVAPVEPVERAAQVDRRVSFARNVRRINLEADQSHGF